MIKQFSESVIKYIHHDALRNDFENTHAQYKQTISEGNINNKSILTKYFNAMEELFKKARLQINPGHPMISFLNNTIELCQENKTYLERAIDITIYKVVLPDEEYKKILHASESFYYEGRAIAFAKAALGAAAYITFTSVPSLPFWIAHSFAIPAEVEMMEGIVEHRGYSSKSDIKTQWIEGIVEVDWDFEGRENVICKKLNPHFSNVDPDSRTLYVLDANDPEKTFQEGLRYPKLDLENQNAHGRIIFFNQLRDARECAHLRHDGFLFDKDGGWRRYHAWTDDQRTEIQKTIQKNTGLHTVEVDIVNDYLRRVGPG